MNYIVRKTTFLSIVLLSLVGSVGIFAQDSQEYLAEIGIQGGGNIYTGDVNSIGTKGLFSDNLSNLKSDFGAFFRYKLNKRIAFRLGYDRTGVKGDYHYYINDIKNTATLNNSGIGLVDLWGEYNFFDLENNKFRRYSKTYSPYIFAGIGYASMPNSNTQSTSAITLPFGFGVKFLLAPRWNLNLQWTNHLLFKDNLEGLSEFDNPNPSTRQNLMNNDLLSGLTIGLSFNFWEKSCDCNNGGRKKSASKKVGKPLNNR